MDNIIEIKNNGKVITRMWRDEWMEQLHSGNTRMELDVKRIVWKLKERGILALEILRRLGITGEKLRCFWKVQCDSKIEKFTEAVIRFWEYSKAHRPDIEEEALLYA